MATKHLIIGGTKTITSDNLLLSDDAAAPTTGRGLADRVAWLYRCVQVRGYALANTPWQITRGDEPVWSSDDPMAPAALTWLDDLMTLLYLTECSLSLVGEAFWFLPRRSQAPRWLTPWSVAPVWDEVAGLVRFDRTTGAGTKPLTVDQVAYFRLPGLHETAPGRAPADVAADAAGLIYNADQFGKGFFERGAIPAVLLSVAGNPSEMEMQRLGDRWKRMLGGVQRAWDTFVVRGEVQPQVVGQPIKDLAMPELTDSKRQDIATALGVPHSLVASDAANYATAQADRLNLYDFTILPEATLVARMINTQVLRGTPWRFQFTPERMNIYQEDEGARSAAWATYVNAGMAPSVAAQIVGVQLPAGVEFADLDPDPAPDPQPTAPVVLEDEAQQAAEDGRQREAAALRRWLKKREGKRVDLAEFVADFLNEWEKTAIALECKALILQLDPGDDEAEQAARMATEREATDGIADGLNTQLRRSFATSPESAEAAVAAVDRNVGSVTDALRRALIESADLGVRIGVQQLESIGMGFDWTLANTAARDWANRYVGELIGGIQETTRAQVRQAVAAWVDNGQPLEALIRELEPTFGRARAELIASTEVTRAYAEGTQAAYREAGVIERMQWRTARDEIVCPICGALHNVQAALGQPFVNPQNGREYFPPAHPRCRCWVVPVAEL